MNNEFDFRHWIPLFGLGLDGGRGGGLSIVVAEPERRATMTRNFYRDRWRKEKTEGRDGRKGKEMKTTSEWFQ